VVLDQRAREPRVHELVTDFIMSLMHYMSCFNADASLLPLGVTLRREQPVCVARYADFYGCAIQLGSDDADRPLPTSNKQLAGLHNQILAQQLEAWIERMSQLDRGQLTGSRTVPAP